MPEGSRQKKAIFNKYHRNEQPPSNPVIREEDEDETETVMSTKVRIKNLDTGEEIEIETEEQEEAFQKEVEKGLDGTLCAR